MASYLSDVFAIGVFDETVFTNVFTDTIKEVNIKEKLIYLNDGIRTYNPIDNVYVDLRYQRANDKSLRVVDMPISASGNLPKGGGKFTGRLATLNDGWKIVPADDADHTLTITGEQIDGVSLSGVDLVNKTGLVHSVDVVYAPPPAAEVIQVISGSGVTSQDKTDIIAGVWANVSRTLTSVVAGGATAQEIWGYSNRVLTSGGGLDETTLHSGLDSYTNKNAWKANSVVVNLQPVLDAIAALNDLSIVDVESSTVLAKEATLSSIAISVAQIPTTDSVVDLSPVLSAIAGLNDVTPAEVRAAFNAVDFKDKNTELEIHNWLDSYTGKASFKSDVTLLATEANLDSLSADIVGVPDNVWNKVV